MSVFAEHDKRFEGLEPRTGLFLAIAALIVVAAIVASLIKHDAFTPTMRVHFLAHSAQGIRKGMSVQLSGFRIGSVKSLQIEPDARVRVTLLIEHKYAGFVTPDSYVGLSKEGLIGASFIEIEPGQDRSRPIEEDGVLRFYRATELADMAQDLKEKVDPILEEVKKVTVSLNDPKGDIRTTIANVREATAQVAALAQQINQLARRSEGRVDAIAGKVDGVLGEAQTTLARARTALDTMGRTLENVDQQVPGLLLRLDQSLKNVESVTADARRLSSSLGDELPPAIREGRGLVQDAGEIVDGVKRAWPIRSLVPPPAPAALPLDSYDGGARR